MIPVACMHKFEDNRLGIELWVDEHRYVAVSENKGSLWIECGSNTMMKRDLVINRDSALALFKLLGEHLGYIESEALENHPDKAEESF